MEKSRNVNKEIVAVPVADIKNPPEHSGAVLPSILHMGVGNFHRSHQAFIYQRLRELDPDKYDHWRIQGVCFLPSDLMLLEKLRAQDGLYHLKMGAPDGRDEVYLIDSIHSVLHVDLPEDYQAILESIARPQTSIISFTITEGGYNINFDTWQFDLDNPAIQADLQHPETPRTVFGMLAKGLGMRATGGGGPVTLLSCDNILKNGQALEFALKSFVKAYNPMLLEWIDQQVTFPNSMVDRITPATTEADRQDFEARYGLKDDCLVVSESFFQWVIEAEPHSILYPLQKAGVLFVADVHPYEEMKLSILNGGHTLVGLAGDALGYSYIHQAVRDTDLAGFFDHYIFEAVIPSLATIENVDFSDYYRRIKERFGNQLIADTTARIISGSSDKIPKFILPVISRQTEPGPQHTREAALIIALWWWYLKREFEKNGMAELVDNARDAWLDIFSNTNDSAGKFIGYRPVFDSCASNQVFVKQYLYFVACLEKAGARHVLKNISNEYGG
ncbi:mannitol dehydrogenase family protein [Niabella terrae]